MPLTDKDGNDALTYACSAGHGYVVKFLINAGLDPDRTNNEGRNAEQETAKYLEGFTENRHGKGSKEENDKSKKEDSDRRESIGGMLQFLRACREGATDGQECNETATKSDEDKQPTVLGMDSSTWTPVTRKMCSSTSLAVKRH